MMKPRVPTEEEEHIIRRNHIDPVGMSVFHSTDDLIILKNHKTGDFLHLARGDRPWKTSN